MKKTIFAALIFSFVVSSCVMESSGTVYHFIIKNETHKTVFIKSQTIKYNEFSTDTIKPFRQFEKEIVGIGCFKDYGDSLIKSYFRQLQINTSDKKINLDIYNRENWTDSTDLSGLICKGGKAFFILKLNESAFK